MPSNTRSITLSRVIVPVVLDRALCGKVLQDVSNIRASFLTGDQSHKSINNRLACLEVSKPLVSSWGRVPFPSIL